MNDASEELKKLLESHESAITTIDYCMEDLCEALECARMEIERIEEERKYLVDLEYRIQRLRFGPEHETSTLWAWTLQHNFFTSTFGVSPSDKGYDWDAPSAGVPISAEFLTSMTQPSLVEPKRSDRMPSSALEWTLHRIAYEVNVVNGIDACMTYVQSRAALNYNLEGRRARLSGMPDFTVISRRRNRRPRVHFVVLERDRPMTSNPDTELLAYLLMVVQARRDASELERVVYGLATDGDTMYQYTTRPYKGAGFGRDIITIIWKIFIEARHVVPHPFGWGLDEDSSGTEGGSDEHVRTKD
ncbi:hypothetical protein BO86DRAFT_396583 [Aspergillus japonicus CBS 114.51]|uniref:Uncharacterized protein n=1 Tax=Aspergillus japonicus CBS 114.51 TaxID=1448312 RepID=A0A8T8XA37_ASPJA|nr:hypothetical protein BO86DRAFT_396583 [Aspergillus japonicus CBS 114.51]RAH84948.1 hypothetical protein BO86DRAFT_396583 [Aspergillus japonicus CBS 114.51]